MSYYIIRCFVEGMIELSSISKDVSANVYCVAGMIKLSSNSKECSVNDSWTEGIIKFSFIGNEYSVNYACVSGMIKFSSIDKNNSINDSKLLSSIGKGVSINVSNVGLWSCESSFNSLRSLHLESYLDEHRQKHTF